MRRNESFHLQGSHSQVATWRGTHLRSEHMQVVCVSQAGEAAIASAWRLDCVLCWSHNQKQRQRQQQATILRGVVAPKTLCCCGTSNVVRPTAPHPLRTGHICHHHPHHQHQHQHHHMSKVVFLHHPQIIFQRSTYYSAANKKEKWAHAQSWLVGSPAHLTFHSIGHPH